MDTLPITTRDGVGAQSLSFRDGKHGVALGGGYGALPGDVLSAVTSDGGSTWSPRARPPLASGVWGGGYVPGSTAIVAVGPKGAVFTRNEGASWIAIDTMNYWSVGFASPDAGWAVGLGGRITRLGGF